MVSCTLPFLALNMNEGLRKMNCLCDEYWLHFPWTNNPRVVQGSFLFNCYFAFVLLCALHLLLCVCVSSVRGADTTDRSRRMCMRWSLVCRSCLLLPLPSVCWCCGRAVCACLLPWIGVCVVRGVRRTVHAWLLPSPHLVCPLCVSAAPLVSPVALHAPHCADQLHNTERPHSR
ncbi:mucin TcMUCII [Trypanosoma cruzi]|nr:mucin TcMUCII [Trypanosoma cruzi]